MPIERICIKNFTAFDEFTMECAEGINVIIGENGTGKTHLMKGVYMILQEINIFNGEPKHLMYNYFKSSNDEVIRNLDLDSSCISAKNNIGSVSTVLKSKNNSIELKGNGNTSVFSKSVYIPAKDILTHSKGFTSLYNERYIPFDKSYADIISKAMLPNLREIPELGNNILPRLESIIGGKVVIDNEEFFIEDNDGKKTKFDVVAEGIKRFALIWQLIMNGCITKGGVLFWDEPEANINPKLMKDVVGILLELSKNDVQIFVTTHNYMFAKYIEVMMNDEDEDVAFHSLYKENDKGATKIETESKFSLLSNNKIIKENINLYDAEIEKVMGDMDDD